MLTFVASIWAVCTPLAQNVEIYRFKNVSANYVVSQLKGEKKPAGGERLLPEGVSVEVDASTNSALVKGSSAEIQRLTRIFSLFDVRSVRIELEIEGFLTPFGHTFSHRIALLNNGSWSLSEPPLELALGLGARVNDDGTCTISLKQSAFGAASDAKVRVAVGEVLRLVDGTPVSEAEFGSKPGRLRLALRVSRIITGTDTSKKT